MLTTDGSLPQQLGVVWSRLLEADSKGPSFISHAACARSVSSPRTFLSCACGALSIVQSPCPLGHRAVYRPHSRHRRRYGATMETGGGWPGAAPGLRRDLHIGCMNKDEGHEPQRVGDDVALAAVDLFPGVVAR